jgi:hypothetical protein
MAFLTMRTRSQSFATHGNGFGLLPPFWRLSDLRPVATSCNHGAP